MFASSTPPTPNGDLHIGHLSGPYWGTDVFVRFQRMNGTRVWHLAATDDFQSYVAQCARREGRPPAEVAAHYSGQFAATLALMDIEPDQVTHTSRDERYSDALTVEKLLGDRTIADLAEFLCESTALAENSDGRPGRR